MHSKIHSFPYILIFLINPTDESTTQDYPILRLFLQCYTLYSKNMQHFSQ